MNSLILIHVMNYLDFIRMTCNCFPSYFQKPKTEKHACNYSGRFSKAELLIPAQFRMRFIDDACLIR